MGDQTNDHVERVAQLEQFLQDLLTMEKQAEALAAEARSQIERVAQEMRQLTKIPRLVEAKCRPNRGGDRVEGM